MDLLTDPRLAFLSLAGVLAGLGLLWRGSMGYRTAIRVGDTGTSAIASMAAGEVRLSGTIEAAEVTLVSALQSEPCVYYHAVMDAGDDDTLEGTDLDEERAVGFLLRDASGAIRVFPRGARWDAPLAFEGRHDVFGTAPAGLALRTGAAIGPAVIEREAAITALLSVRAPAVVPTQRGRRTYRERRLGPGDTITVVGRAAPFSSLADPTEADVDIGGGVSADDPEVLANVAEAREAGLLVDPAKAWGNAAIPGFGIGRPVHAPAIDADATPAPLADAAEAERSRQRFAIDPDALVLAAAPDVPLLIAYGAPGAIVERHHDRFLIGLLGAVLAIASAAVLVIVLAGAGGGLGA